jgi:hypothetical protein
MRALAIALATLMALASFAEADGASAKSRGGYRHHHGKHHVDRHRHRHRIVVRHAYRGPAITLWQKRFEEPQGRRDFPYGYGTAYAPD